MNKDAESRWKVGMSNIKLKIRAYALPASQFLLGVIEVIEHNECGHSAYLLGKISEKGWWYYFPIAISVKTTIPLLLLFGMSIGFSATSRFGGLARPVMVAAAVFTTVMAIGMGSYINIGIRHVLVAYPMMALGGAAVVARHSSAGRVGPRLVIGVLLLVWHGAASLAAHPDYLPYFNEIARGREEKVLIDSNLDWGQDLERLGHFLRENPNEPVRVLYWGRANPELLGVPALRPPRAGESRPGWLAVSIHKLVHWREDIPALKKFWGKEPDGRIGKSIFLFRIDRIRYSLVTSEGPSGGEAIAAPGGRAIPIVPGSMYGFVDAVSGSPRKLSVAGWASEAKFGDLASQIVVFIDGQAQESWYMRVSRPDVEKQHPGMRLAGYQIDLPYPRSSPKEGPEIRVFAISKDEKAAELQYRALYRHRNRTYILGRKGSK